MKTSPLARSFGRGVYLIVFAFGVFVSVGTVQAQCDCALGADLRFKNAEHILVGTVVSTKPKALTREGKVWDEIHFQVDETWKQDVDNVVKLLVRSGFEDPFKVGEQWLVFTHKSRGKELLVDRGCCSWTNFIEKSRNRGEYDKVVEIARVQKVILSKKKRLEN